MTQKSSTSRHALLVPSKKCTVFEIIDGAQIILKSQNEAIAHDQWSTSWFTRVRLFEKLKFVLFGCVVQGKIISRKKVVW